MWVKAQTQSSPCYIISLPPMADNCTGQNKNRYMMYYLAWRVLADLHDEITMSFLPVGHTKFVPDWCFGLAKQCFEEPMSPALMKLPTPLVCLRL